MKFITALLFLLSSASAIWAQVRAPEIIVDRADSAIFPASWLTDRINARAELLSPERQSPARELVRSALAKYPPAVLGANLQKVYVVGALSYSGVTAGGTNSRTAVYVVSHPRFSPADFERNLHAEFSSILFRNFPHHFEGERWRQINPPDFSYRGSGVQAIRNGQAAVGLSAALHAEGFVNEYGKASPEEDFNSYAGRLFLGDAALWAAIEQYPKVRAKADLVIAFYGKLDAACTPEFFRALR